MVLGAVAGRAHAARRQHHTYLTGQADKLNPTTGKVEHVPVRVISRTQVDPSKSDDDVIVFVNACVNVDKGQPPGCLTRTTPG